MSNRFRCTKCGAWFTPDEHDDPATRKCIVNGFVAELERTAEPKADPPAPEPPLFTLDLPSDIRPGATERIQFTASALARMASMEKEGKIRDRIAQDNLDLRSALAAANNLLRTLGMREIPNRAV